MASLPLLEMFDVDMVKSFVKGRRAVTTEFDGAVAETTPELRLIG